MEAPHAKRLRALVDTGASHTFVDANILHGLLLMPVGKARMHTPSSGVMGASSDTFEISLALLGTAGVENALEFPTLRVTSAEFSSVQNFDALIGRDVLQHCVLTYNGSMGWFTLAY